MMHLLSTCSVLTTGNKNSENMAFKEFMVS